MMMLAGAVDDCWSIEERSVVMVEGDVSQATLELTSPPAHSC